MLLILTITSLTFILCFSISHIFLSVFLYEDKNELKNFSKDFFSFIFGLSNIILIMIVLHIADVDEFQIRNLLWILSLWTFIIIMFYLIPYYFIYLAIIGNGENEKIKFRKLRQVSVAFTYLAYLVFCYKFMNLFKTEKSWFFMFYISPVNMMEFLGLVGILASALLSGYGSTHCILNYIVYPFFKKTLKKLERLKKNSIFSIKEEISLKENQIIQATDAFSPSGQKCYTFSTEEKDAKSINSDYEKNNLNSNLHKNFMFPYDQESLKAAKSKADFENTKNTVAYDSDDISSSKSNSDEYLSNDDDYIGYQSDKTPKSTKVIKINNININNTYVNFALDKTDSLSSSKNIPNNEQAIIINSLNNKNENFNFNANLSNVNENNINNININNAPKNDISKLKHGFKKNSSSNNHNNPKEKNSSTNTHVNANSGLRNRKKSLKSTFKGVFNYVIGKDSKKDLEEEIEQLKILYSEMEMQMRLIKDKTILFRNKFISRLSYLFTYITGKTLAFYCIYRIIMTIKNLLFLNYSDINVMLREEVLNIIDFFINIIFKLLNLDVETIFYTVLEQYFSLTIVGLIIIINIRSFLNTILFIYTKTLKKYDSKTNRKQQMVFLAYFVGLFYVTSSIFLIFNLPITYRTELVNVYGHLDYSLLRHLYDKTFIYSTFCFFVVEFLVYQLQLSI